MKAGLAGYGVTELTPQEATAISGGWIFAAAYAIFALATIVAMGILVSKLLHSKG
ncbi:hypothetical protein [Mesorhizobium carmichaelinearum]|uniref:hypothetical protein n=1 Tax=Mesorhizobium carmichaelinearum TaxID=1208188 RepID=UPI0015CDD95C|nr:hypothetical protein [Mesorhizobium carmichaelinearum]